MRSLLPFLASLLLVSAPASGIVVDIPIGVEKVRIASCESGGLLHGGRAIPGIRTAHCLNRNDQAAILSIRTN